MQVRCTICGQQSELNKIHKDYQKLAKDPQAVYICFNCNNRLQIQAREKQQKTTKPL
ncbi:MAG: DUF2197 domain-containing protein [Bacillota bacterium]